MLFLWDFGACCATAPGAGPLWLANDLVKKCPLDADAVSTFESRSRRPKGSATWSASQHHNKFSRKISNQHDMRGLHQSHLTSDSSESRRGSACVRTVCLLFLSGGEGLRCKECVLARAVFAPASTTAARACSPLRARCSGHFKINEF